MAAKRIPQSFINEVLSRSDIVELIQNRIQLKKQGARLTACCPFHNEKTPSFSVSPQKQMYYCFGCKASGNAISFLIEHDGMTFLEALESLASRLGLQLPRNQQQPEDTDYMPMLALNEQAARLFEQNLKSSKEAIDYLKQRGLSGEIVKHYHIGYAPSGWDTLNNALGHQAKDKALMAKSGLLIQKDSGGFYDRFRDRIMFPIRNTQGKVVAFGGRILDQGEPKYLNSPESTLFHKRSELYGLFEARQALRQLDRVLIVEGYMDVVALAQHGIQYAVATLGTAATLRHVHKLLRYTHELVFCFDGDRAGRDAAWHALEVLLPVMRDDITIRFMLLPQGDDPDSLVRQIGHDAFEQQIQAAMPFSDFFFHHISASHDLDTLEGKAHYGQQAMRHLSAMPIGILQSMMIRQLGETVHMNEAQLRALVEQKPRPAPPILESPPTKPSNAPPRAPRAPITNLMQQLLALLIQHPPIATELKPPEPIDTLQASGAELLLAVINSCEQHQNMNTAALLAQWQDSPEGELLNTLAHKEPPVEPELWSNEANDMLQRLFQQSREAESQRLMELAKQGNLDEQGKKRLMALLSS